MVSSCGNRSVHVVVEHRADRYEYQRRPPEREEVGLKGPNIVNESYRNLQQFHN